MRAVLATIVLAIAFAATAPAQTALHRHGHHKHHQHEAAHHRVQPQHHAQAQQQAAKVSHHSRVSRQVERVVRWLGQDYRPSQWCGWFMRQMFNVTDREYNRAAKWADWGHWSPGPRVGAVVVWRHHVGLIKGGPDGHGQWLVNSGNDNHMVRTRYMSLAHAIAFRMP
jgi:hypothetical protein